MCSKEIGLSTQKLLTILSSLVNINWGGLIGSLNEHKNLHFDIEKDIRTTFKNYETNTILPF